VSAFKENHRPEGGKTQVAPIRKKKKKNLASRSSPRFERFRPGEKEKGKRKKARSRVPRALGGGNGGGGGVVREGSLTAERGGLSSDKAPAEHRWEEKKKKKKNFVCRKNGPDVPGDRAIFGAKKKKGKKGGGIGKAASLGVTLLPARKKKRSSYAEPKIFWNAVLKRKSLQTRVDAIRGREKKGVRSQSGGSSVRKKKIPAGRGKRDTSPSRGKLPIRMWRGKRFRQTHLFFSVADCPKKEGCKPKDEGKRRRLSVESSRKKEKGSAGEKKGKRGTDPSRKGETSAGPRGRKGSQGSGSKKEKEERGGGDCSLRGERRFREEQSRVL